jgi:hypothetical protein
MSHEKKSTEAVASSPAAYSPNSLGMSRPEVRPLQKVAMDNQNEDDSPLQMYGGNVSEYKAFSIPAQDKNSKAEAPDIKPFQLKADKTGLSDASLNNKGPIQLKEEMWIGSTKYKLGSFKKVEDDTGSPLNTDQRLIVSHWMKQEIEFKDNAEFAAELATLLLNWEKQKVFYPTTTAVTTAQSADSTVKMYSSRSFGDIKQLYLWANGKVTLVGFEEFVAAQNPTGEAPGAPFKAHFGDRAHTIKHWNQKKTAGTGVGLISIDMKPAGVTAIQKEKTEGRIAKGGEGYVAGKVGLKHEKNFYSAAIGDKKETWDAIAPNIQQIELHDWSPKPDPAPVAEEAGEAQAD